MTKLEFTLFDTPIGRCAIVWSEQGIAGLHLPERSDEVARKRLARRFPGALEAEPPLAVTHAIDGIAKLLSGERRDLAEIALDMQRLEPFQRQVYAIARKIPPGTTLTYGEIAERLGDRTLARDVGQAMGKNPYPIVVPCHRVVAANGKPGGFSAPGGVGTKLRMLAIEGAALNDQADLFAGAPR